jgi:hypothetical protein
VEGGGMNKCQFREAVWSGLGRAILYARNNDVGEFKDVILDACLHCYSVDPQTEGTRAPYMLELVNLTPDREFYRAEVLSALPNCGDDWGAVQRFRLASYLAMDGDDGARRVMYEHFSPGPCHVEETGIDFVQMDGMEGFIFAAGKVGELLLKPSKVNGGHLIWHATERFGKEQALAALPRAGETDPRVEAYRIAVEAYQGEHKRDDLKEIKELAYENLKPRLCELRPHRLSLWGRHASAEDLELAASDLQAAQSPDRQLPYLRIFSRRPFPLDHESLLQLAASDDDRVAVAAAVALSNITHPSVRALALRLVETRRSGRWQAISMLDRNWKSGDHEIVLRWFEDEEDRAIRHDFGIDLRGFWKDHPDPATECGMMFALYEKGPCSACRELVLSRLIELNALPDSIREECAYDANEDIRRLVAGKR